MQTDRVDEGQVERDLELIAQIRRMAWQRNPPTLLALIEGLQVKLLLEDISRRQRQMYRAIIEYYEDVLEERIEKDDDVDGDEVRRTASSYIRNLLKALDD